MDWKQVASIAVAILTPLSPYLSKAGQKVAEEVGKAVFEKATSILSAIRLKFERDQDQQGQEVLALFENNPPMAKDTLITKITQKAEADSAFGSALAQLVDDTRTILFDCLRQKFRRQDLKEVYFLLGIGWDDLTGEMASRAEKAMALIEYVEMREQVPALVAAMWEVYPGLKC